MKSNEILYEEEALHFLSRRSKKAVTIAETH